MGREQLKTGTLILDEFFFVTKLIDFPKIRHKNVEYFKWVHAHKPKFRLDIQANRFVV